MTESLMLRRGMNFAGTHASVDVALVAFAECVHGHHNYEIIDNTRDADYFIGRVAAWAAGHAATCRMYKPGLYTVSVTVSLDAEYARERWGADSVTAAGPGKATKTIDIEAATSEPMTDIEMARHHLYGQVPRIGHVDHQIDSFTIAPVVETATTDAAPHVAAA
ncbi:hypothetical protein [Streptomyces lasiicapitis]|uniref:hypothetical protein n=1 Tax=Streptomyces lasiicapitis TaxID=1923961 RepID=UPI00367AFBE2